MKKRLLLSIALLSCIGLSAQDQTIDRNVTVEREFQPTIQSAGKINVAPTIEEQTIAPVEVNYSTYSNPLSPDFNFVKLNYASINFNQRSYNKGFLRGGIGHVNSQFDFVYSLREKKAGSLSFYAHHQGQWGRRTIANTTAGLQYEKTFDPLVLYFGVDAENTYFTRYGAFYIPGEDTLSVHRYRDMDKDHRTSMWGIDTRIGVRSKERSDLQFCVQTGYEAFVYGKRATEHQINTLGNVDWHSEEHHAGLNLNVRNRFYSYDSLRVFNPSLLTDSGAVHATHAIKLEPYYAFRGRRFRIHVGVNVDLALTDTIHHWHICRPSPNVEMEANLIKEWLALYAGAIGDYSITSVRDAYRANRYLQIDNELQRRLQPAWCPLDAFIGFKIHPQANLLIDIYGKYAIHKDNVFYALGNDGYFNPMNFNDTRWQIGGKVSFHYKDIVSMSLNGFYNVWNMQFGNDALQGQWDAMEEHKHHALDKPTWGVQFRLDAKINSKWSLYTDNYFGGGRYAITAFDVTTNTLTCEPLKTTIDVNLGAAYNIDKWLSVYLQLNNLINRHNDVFYSYQTAGINFLAGVSWIF